MSSGEKYLRKFLTDDVIHDLYRNESLQLLDNEWKQLNSDRNNLRQIFPSGDTLKIVLPCNLERLIYNAKKKHFIFHIEYNQIYLQHKLFKVYKD